MYISKHLFFSFLVLLSGCGLSNSEDPPIPFEPVFTADINGEPYDISNSAKAGIWIPRGSTTEFTVSAKQYSKELYPYREALGISIIYEKGKTSYSTSTDTVYINGEFYGLRGGFYSEWDGDANISWYNAREDDEGFITVEMEELSDARTAVSGTFEMRLIVDSRADPYSHRVGQDTLHITNGEYRLLLEDYRDE